MNYAQMGAFTSFILSQLQQVRDDCGGGAHPEHPIYWPPGSLPHPEHPIYWPPIPPIQPPIQPPPGTGIGGGPIMPPSYGPSPSGTYVALQPTGVPGIFIMYPYTSAPSAPPPPTDAPHPAHPIVTP